MVHVGIIGAGISGLVCGTRLSALLRVADVPLKVTVFEWGRGPGGRTARRRVQVDGVGEVSFDHAAPFFTAATDRFLQELLVPWEERGLVARWVVPPASGWSSAQLWVGQPSNHAVCQGLAADLGAAGNGHAYGRHVTSAKFVDGSWRVTATNRLAKPPVEESWELDAVVLSDKLLVTPNIYAVLSSEDLGALAIGSSVGGTSDSPPAVAESDGHRLAGSTPRSHGTVVLMLAFAGPAAAAVRAAFGRRAVLRGDELRAAVGSTCDLELIVRDSAKPGRSGAAGGANGSSEPEVELFVTHSTASFAAAHLVEDAGSGPALDDTKAVQDHLCNQFFAAATTPGTSLPEPSFISTMTWDHAGVSPTERLPGTHRLDAPRRAGLCGDFFGGFGQWQSDSTSVVGGVEAAALSGLSVADELAEVLIRWHAKQQDAHEECSSL